MNTTKRIISLMMCMLMVLTMVPMSVFAVEATEIDTIHIEGVLAPQYGQTVEDHFDDMIKKGDDGEFKVNGLGYYVCDLFDDMGFSLLDKDKKRLDKSEVIVEGIYYFAMEFLPSDGYVIPNDVAVTLDGALSVETEFDEDGWLIAYAKYEVEATEIDTIHIEGLPAPVYGQTGDEYVMASVDKHKNGELKVNGNIGSDWMFGNVLMEDVDLYDGNKNNFTGKTTTGTYYAKLYLSADDGYVIPADVAVTVDGAVSVEKDFDEYGSLIVYAKYEVKATKIDTIDIEGIPVPLYGQTPKDYLDDVIAKVKVNNEPYDSKNQAFGNLNVEWQGIYDSTKANSLLSSSETFSEGTYYYMLELYPKTGFVFADIDDISASVNGTASVELEASTVYDDTVLVWVKFEVKCPHTYDNACDAECNVCKTTRTPAAHTGGTATCKEKAKCTVCGAEYGSLASHKEVTLAAKSATYTSTGLTAGKKCSVCGKITVAQKTVAKLTLGKVTGLKAKKVKVAKASEITLSWNSVGNGVKYEVYVKNGSKWTKLTTTSKTSYTVKKDGKKKSLKADKEYQFKVRAVVDGANGAYSSVLKVETIPATAKLTLKAGKKALTASWSKVSDISGYEVQYSTSKKFTKKTTKTVKAKKSSKKATVKKLSKGKKYYVRIRTYKTVDGKKVYSGWSTVKNVKVK